MTCDEKVKITVNDIPSLHEVSIGLDELTSTALLKCVFLRGPAAVAAISRTCESTIKLFNKVDSLNEQSAEQILPMDRFVGKHLLILCACTQLDGPDSEVLNSGLLMATRYLWGRLAMMSNEIASLKGKVATLEARLNQ